MRLKKLLLSRACVVALIIVLLVGTVFFFGVAVALAFIALVHRQSFMVALGANEAPVRVGLFSCSAPDWATKGPNAFGCPQAIDKATGALFVVFVVLFLASVVLWVVLTVIRRCCGWFVKKMGDIFFLVLLCTFLASLLIGIIAFGLHTTVVKWREDHFSDYLDNSRVQWVVKPGTRTPLDVLGAGGICAVVCAILHLSALVYVCASKESAEGNTAKIAQTIISNPLSSEPAERAATVNTTQKKRPKS